MPASNEQQCQQDFALVTEREIRLLLLLPYALLIIATALAVANDHGSSTKVLEDLGLAVLTGAWMALLQALRGVWHERQRLMAACYVVLLALMAALVLRDPLYGFYSWTGYVWGSLMFATRWRVLAYAPVAIITATSQHGGLPTRSASSWASWFIFIAINLLAAAAISWFARVREEEHARRKQTIDELTDANAQLAASLEENAGLRAQLLEQAREAGVLDERQRMAGEIHDTLAQGLVGIITQLEAAAHALPYEDDWRRHTDAAIELARESLGEARRSVQALAPAPLERACLSDALGAVAGKWSERSHVAATVTTTGQPRELGEDVELAVLRTAQEALANVGKHAGARRVVVTLSYMDELVTLDVCDDGIGFVPTAIDAGEGGFGLTAMRRRVEGLSGTLEIESVPGAGTTVAASIPVVAADVSEAAPASPAGSRA